MPLTCRWHDLSLSGSALPSTSLLANQQVISESELARDHCQSAIVTLPVNLSVSFLSRVSIHLNYFIAIHGYVQLSLFRLVCLAIFIIILTDLITN